MAGMEFEWDAAKDAANLAKHGVSLADAARLDWGNAQEELDDRSDYGEFRYSSLVPLEGRLHVCIYTTRQGIFRVISLRKANAREVRRYENLK